MSTYTELKMGLYFLCVLPMAFGAPFELALLARREVAFSTVILPSIVKKEEGQNSVSAQELTMHGSVTKDKPDVSCTSVDEHPGSSSTANGVSIIHSYLSNRSYPRCLCVTGLHHMNPRRT